MVRVAFAKQDAADAGDVVALEMPLVGVRVRVRARARVRVRVTPALIVEP